MIGAYYKFIIYIREAFPEVITAKSEEAQKGDMPESRYMSKIALHDNGYKPGNVRHGDVFATYPRSAGLPEELYIVVAHLGQPTPGPFPAPEGIPL